jgi:hypothetical protein
MEVEKLAAGLVVAAATGLTVLAYKHPEAYNKIFWPLVVICAVPMIAAMGWDAGVTNAYVRLVPYLVKDKFDEARGAIAATRILSIGLLLCYGLAGGYLVFLGVLPHLVEKKKPD